MKTSGQERGGREEIFFSPATVGEQGQLVLPATLRESRRLTPGDTVLTMVCTPDFSGELIGIVREALAKLDAEPAAVARE